MCLRTQDTNAPAEASNKRKWDGLTERQKDRQSRVTLNAPVAYNKLCKTIELSQFTNLI